MKRCPSCGEENADRARFCQNCATALGESEPSQGEVRKVVTIVFADVTGSTSLGERLDPEAMRRVMGRYFDEMAAVIERHGGTVEKFIGDAVMAVFGIPRLHEDDALRAVRAAAGMRDALAAMNEDLERDHGVGLAARIGVNTGEVVAGDPTAGQRLVTGDAVNVAARLEQAAEPGQVLLGDSTFRLVKDAVEVEAVEPLALKGKAEPVPAFRLLAVREDTAGHERHLDSPMVGRQKELEMLERALERVVTERTSHLFTLLGPAGVGKSRLVQEFLVGPASSAVLLRGRCLSYGEGITFYPLAEVVQEAAGVERSDDVGVARAKLARIAAGADDADRIVALVAGLLAWGEPVAAEEAFWGVRKLLEHLARDRAVAVVFDDIHWAEPTFLDLIEHLADWTRDAALLLLCVARPELLEIRSGWAGGKMNASTILLEPLDGEASSSLVDNLLGRAQIPPSARARILEAAEGNPLFVEEMLAMLIDDGLLRFEDGAWRAVEDLANVTVPPTIQLLLAARLDRLDAEERAVIERGAVEGKVFHTGAVTTLASEALRPNVPSRLLALARKELIRPDRADFAGEDAFRFRHLLIRDAAYQAMPKEQRADLHERFAGWLEHAAGDRVTEYEEILAHHLEQAYRYRLELGPSDDRTSELGAAAARRHRSSADRATERGEFSVALNHLERCVEMTTESDRVAARIELARTCGELNRFPESLATAEEAKREAGRLGDERSVRLADLERARARGQVDPSFTTAEGTEIASSALAWFESAGDEVGQVRALVALSRYVFYAGHCAEALAITERLLDRASTLPFHERDVVASGFFVYSYFGPGRVEDGFDFSRRAEAVLGDSLVGRALTRTHQLGILGMQGREEEARAAKTEAARLWEELGNPDDSITMNQLLGETEWRLGRLDLAEASFRESIAALDALGETGFNSTTHGSLAVLLCEQDRFDDAAPVAERCRELTSGDDFASLTLWHQATARIASHRGEHEAAIELADAAIGFVDDTDYLCYKGDAHVTRAIVLANAGRIDEARADLERALAFFEAKGVVPTIARTRERLAELDRAES